MEGKKEEREFLTKKGWTYIRNGYKLDHDELAEGDVTYLRNKKDIYLQKTSYWESPEGEFAFEDIDGALDWAGYDEEKGQKKDISAEKGLVGQPETPKTQ